MSDSIAVCCGIQLYLPRYAPHLLLNETPGAHEAVPEKRLSIPEGQTQNHAVAVECVALVAGVVYLQGCGYGCAVG